MSDQIIIFERLLKNSGEWREYARTPTNIKTLADFMTNFLKQKGYETRERTI
jgi:hypothetical protein